MAKQSRDTENYIYVEVRLPKKHPAVQNLMDHATSLERSVRSLCKDAILQVYGAEVLPSPALHAPVQAPPRNPRSQPVAPQTGMGFDMNKILENAAAANEDEDDL